MLKSNQGGVIRFKFSAALKKEKTSAIGAGMKTFLLNS